MTELLNILMLVFMILGAGSIMLAQIGLLKPRLSPLLRKAQNGGSPQHAFGAFVILAACFFSAGYAIYTRQIGVVGASVACFFAFLWMADKAKAGSAPNSGNGDGK